jgi:epoxyqueuosine reductase QueG
VNAAAVKQRAKELGADLAGVADVKEVHAHPAPDCPRGPADILTGARSVVVLARRLLSGMSRELDSRNRNVHYAGEMILSSMESLTYDIVRFLEDGGFPSIMLPSAYSRSHQTEVAAKTLSLAHLAVEAGLGTLGLNLQLLTPEFGPRVILGAVVTTAELEPDTMRTEALCAGPECGRCLLACPGDAIRAWRLDLERCRPHSSPYGYQFLQSHVERILALPDPKDRLEAARSTDTLMIWQSMLRGVGIYSGCTRCADVCPVGADYERHLSEVQKEIPETNAEKEATLARLRAENAAPDLERHRRWIGV